jgi:hypothetical protein
MRTEDQRASALLHELCHIKRADLLVMSLVRLSLAMFWFNPLCWMVCRRLKQEQERACDELVLTVGIKPSTYAATLLFFKRTADFSQNVPASFLGLFGSTAFHERVEAILRQKLTLKEVTMKTKIMLAIAVILTVSFAGAARPSKTVSDHPPTLNMVTAVLPRPVMPAAGASANAPNGADQDKKIEADKEKVKDKEKQKEEQKHTIVIANAEGREDPIEVAIVTRDTSRNFRIEKLLTIKESQEDGTQLSIMFRITPGENSREVYERVAAKVRQELPAGYALEPEFNGESGAVTLKIKVTGAQGVSKEFIKKIADAVKAEIK